MARKLPDINSSDVEGPESYSVDMSVTDNGLEVDREVPLELGQVNGAMLAEEKALRDFMRQEVTFTIHNTSDPNQPDPVQVGVNGVIKKFKRGETHVAPRMFLESLIRTVRTTRPVVYVDANGLYQTRNEITYSEAYPLAILDDPAGQQGRRWFEFQRKNAV